MKKYTYCLCRAAALLLALTALLSCMSMSASALSFVSLPGANITDTTQPLVGMRNTNVTDTASASSMMEKMEAGIYWFGCFRDIYQALNLQYDRVSSVLTLDPMNFQGNELWILRPISSNSVYFTLEPLSTEAIILPGKARVPSSGSAKHLPLTMPYSGRLFPMGTAVFWSIVRPVWLWKPPTAAVRPGIRS